MKCPHCRATFPSADVDEDRQRCPECNRRLKPKESEGAEIGFDPDHPGIPRIAGGATIGLIMIVCSAGIANLVMPKSNSKEAIIAREAAPSPKPAEDEVPPWVMPLANALAKKTGIRPLPRDQSTARQSSEPQSVAPQSVGPRTQGQFARIDRLAEEPVLPAKPVIPSPDPNGQYVQPVRPTAPARDDSAVWNLTVDAPNRQQIEFPADLELPLCQDGGYGIVLPTFASMRGPLVLRGAILGDDASDEKPSKKSRAKQKSPVPGRPNETKPEVIAEVVDLRTQKILGQFPAPQWRAGGTLSRLSPDGMYLVCPNEYNSKESLLRIFRRDVEEQLGSIELSGDLFWYEFVGPKQFAMLSFQPKGTDGVLSVWDVVRQKELKKIPIKLSSFPINIGDRRGPSEFQYLPTAVMGDVSPNGHYVALGAQKGLIVVDLEDGAEVGLIPAPVPFTDHKSLKFSPDGTELWSLATCKNPSDMGFTISTWDFATGRRLSWAPLADQPTNFGSLEGEILPGPVSGTILYRIGTLNGQFKNIDFTTGKPSFNGMSSIVFDLLMGSQISKRSEIPVRWAGSDRILALTHVLDKMHAIKVVPFDVEKFRETAEENLAVTSPRPKAPIAKSVTDSKKVTPPDRWSPPSTIDMSVAPNSDKIDLLAIPSVAGRTAGAILSYSRQKQPRPRDEFQWQRIDLKSGHKIGEPIRLWPWSSDPSVNARNERPLPLAALSLDGSVLAACDPMNHSRVDVWNTEGKRINGLQVHESAAIEWLGWSPSGKLLTVVLGSLTAWDTAKGTSKFVVDGEFTGPVEYGCQRKWLALAHGDVVDLIDSETGDCLARCSPSQSGGEIQFLAVSPDGKSLATAREALDDGKQKEIRGKDGWKFRSYLIETWDTVTGRSFSVAGGYPQIEFLKWVNAEHLLVASGFRASMPLFELMDRRTQSKAAIYRFDQVTLRRLNSENGLPVAATPDGRVWLSIPWKSANSSGRYWRRMAFPQIDNPSDEMLYLSDRKRIESAETAVRVEADLGSESRGRATATNLAQELLKKGYQIGPDGFLLRYSHEIIDSGDSLTFGKTTTRIPTVKVKWELLDPKGVAIWEQKSAYKFRRTNSRYFKSSSQKGSINGPAGEIAEFTEVYEFGGIDPRYAMEEELLDSASKHTLPEGLPSGSFLASDGKFAPLPLSIEYSLSLEPTSLKLVP